MSRLSAPARHYYYMKMLNRFDTSEQFSSAHSARIHVNAKIHIFLMKHSTQHTTPFPHHRTITRAFVHIYIRTNIHRLHTRLQLHRKNVCIYIICLRCNAVSCKRCIIYSNCSAQSAMKTFACGTRGIGTQLFGCGILMRGLLPQQLGIIARIYIVLGRKHTKRPNYITMKFSSSLFAAAKNESSIYYCEI